MKASANSTNPNTTFTEFNQPPDFGRLFNQLGKIANSTNGSANVIANPNIAIKGFINSPPAASMETDPTIGTVQLKETNTKVNAIKKIPAYPPLSPLASILFTKLEGSVSSNIPKNDNAKNTKIAKNIILGNQ